MTCVQCKKEMFEFRNIPGHFKRITKDQDGVSETVIGGFTFGFCDAPQCLQVLNLGSP